MVAGAAEWPEQQNLGLAEVLHRALSGRSRYFRAFRAASNSS